MPGYRHSVTKYASPIDNMYGQMDFATSHRAMKPPETEVQSMIKETDYITATNSTVLSLLNN
jgi:hypothetical protein